jgi:hypothetical protein
MAVGFSYSKKLDGFSLGWGVLISNLISGTRPALHLPFGALSKRCFFQAKFCPKFFMQAILNKA